MTYSTNLQKRLRARRKAAQQPRTPVGVLARLVVGRLGLDVTDVPHASRLRSGAYPIDSDLAPSLPTDPDMPEVERLQRMLPIITIMAGRLMDARASGDRRGRERLDALAYMAHQTLGFANILVLEIGPHRTYYELAGDPQAACAHLQELIDDLGDRPASGSFLTDWIARHATAFGPGRGPADVAGGPMRGLIARVTAGSTVVDRTMVRDSALTSRWREGFERSFEKTIRDIISADGGASPDKLKELWTMTFSFAVTQAMDVEQPEDAATGLSLHGGGLALLEELGWANILMIQGVDDDEQIEILGHPLDAHHTISRLCADLQPDSEHVDVRAWIDAHPELFGRRANFPHFVRHASRAHRAA